MKLSAAASAAVFVCVPGMTHRPQFQAKPGTLWSAVTGRKDDVTVWATTGLTLAYSGPR